MQMRTEDFRMGLVLYFLNVAGQVFPEINLNFIVPKKGGFNRQKLK